MARTGKIFKRCGCRQDGKRLEQHCPRLPERGHGSWYYHCSVTTLLGGRERIRRGGFASQTAARLARDECLADSVARRTAEGWTGAAVAVALAGHAYPDPADHPPGLHPRC
jgi:hypothetical protein